MPLDALEVFHRNLLLEAASHVHFAVFWLGVPFANLHMIIDICILSMKCVFFKKNLPLNFSTPWALKTLIFLVISWMFWFCWFFGVPEAFPNPLVPCLRVLWNSNYFQGLVYLTDGPKFDLFSFRFWWTLIRLFLLWLESVCHFTFLATLNSCSTLHHRAVK